MFYQLKDNVLIDIERIEAVERKSLNTETGKYRVLFLMRSGGFIEFALDIHEWDKLMREMQGRIR